MQKSKKLLSILMATIILFSIWSVGITGVTAAETITPVSPGLKPIVIEPIERPVVTCYCTPVTRVAAAVGSTEPGSTIVKATPSGIPELSGAYATQAYAGETPAYTRITFQTQATGITIKKVSADNSTISFGTIEYTPPGTYCIDVIGGAANAGEAITFTVDYTWTDGRTYQEKCVTYVESVVTGGSYYEMEYTWKLAAGSGNWYRGKASASTRLLGKNVYYEQPANMSDVTYGIYNVASASFLANTATGYDTAWKSTESSGTTSIWEPDPRDDERYDGFMSQTPTAHIYIDPSQTYTLSDINLRIDSNAGRESDDVHSADEPMAIALLDSYVYTGSVDSHPGSFSNNADAQSLLGYTLPSKISRGLLQPSNEGKGQDSIATISAAAGVNEHIITTNFRGAVADITDGASYTIINRYYRYFRASSAHVTITPTVPVKMVFHIVDKSELKAQIDMVMSSEPTSPLNRNTNKGVNPQAWYYKSGFGNFQNAYTEALRVYNNPKSTPTEIEDVLKSLKTAYSGLILASADYTQVNKLLNEADKILANSESYPTNEIERLNEAIDMVKSGYNILYQPAVDTMAENLQYAIDNVRPYDADYSAVRVAIARFDALNGANYTTASWRAVKDAVAAVEYGLDATQQDVVDGYAKAINDAIDNLQAYYADFTTLNEYLAEAKGIDKNLYANSALLTNAIKNAQAAVDDNKANPWPSSRQSEVDDLAQALRDKIDGLIYRSANTTAIKEAIERDFSGDLQYYDQALLNEYSVLISQARGLIEDPNLTILNQEEIDTLTLDINAKYEEVLASYSKPVGPANKEALKAAIDRVISGDEQYYDQIVLEEYKALVAEGTQMYNDVTLTEDNQAEIDAKTAELTAKFNELNATYFVPANKQALKTALDNASEINKENYVDNSAMAEFILAVSKGETVYENESLSENDQATVDAAVLRIENAIIALKLKDADLTTVETVSDAIAAHKKETIEVVTYIEGVLGIETKPKHNTADIEALEAEIAEFMKGEYTILDNADIVAFASEKAEQAKALPLAVYTEYLDVAIKEYDETDLTPYTVATAEIYTNAYNSAKSLENADQTAINEAVTALANAKAGLQIAAFFEEKEGTTTVIDKENGIIYGLEEGVSDIENFVTYEGGEIEYEYTDNGFGTGAVVNFVVNGEVKETYVIVIFGDLTGDGVVDGFDYSVLAAMSNGDLEATDVQNMAADLNGDTVADTFDLAYLGAVTIGEAQISQNSKI